MAYNDDIIKALRNTFEPDNLDRFTNCALVFAYNGTGKTRLSYDFAHYGRKDNTPQHTLYYNAYTEDLFTWNNDIENDDENKQYKLLINKNSQLIRGLAGYDITADLHKYLQVFTDIDFRLYYEKIKKDNLDGIVVDGENETEDDKEIPSYIVFSKKSQHLQELNGEQVLIDGDSIEYIKISRGEERLFVWCFFRCIMDQVIGGNDAYKNIEYIYIDDPISSLDDNNVIAFAAQLYNAIRDSLQSERNVLKSGHELKRRIKFIVSTHHGLFFHVMVHGLASDTKLGRYYLHRDRDDNELLLKSMSDNTPFYYNVAMMSEIQEAIRNDKLYTYHFTIMRSVMEKIAEFFGHFDYRFILDGIEYKGNKFEESAFSKGELIELYSRIVNVFSHQGSFFVPTEMNEDNKDSLKTLFYHIKNKYRFVLPNLTDERSEKEIFNERKNKKTRK